jgi:hypothetical protein
MRPGVFPTTRVEPPAGVPPADDPAIVPDDELSAAQLADLITLPASAPSVAGRCTPDDLNLSLYGFDAAAGHRFSAVLAINVGGDACTLIGWPGMGFCGDNGSAFDLVAEHEKTPSDRVGAVPHDPDEPVALEPGGRATVDLEWTGSLAGAYDEKVSLIAVQLVTGGPAGAIVIPDDEPVDIGDGTTVRVRQWAPAAPPSP